MRLVPVRDSSKLYAGVSSIIIIHYYESHYKCVAASTNLINHPQKCYYTHIPPQTVNKEQEKSNFNISLDN